MYKRQVTFYQADKDNPWTYLWIGIDGDKAKLYLNSVGLDSEHLIFTYEKDEDVYKRQIQQ